MTARPPQPPVMRLIEERRERLGLSFRAAAVLAAPLSEGRWRQLERGYRKIRGVLVTEEAPDSTLARMALAVRLAPEDVRPYSERAARMMADLAADREASGRRDADDAARMIDALGDRAVPPRLRPALEADVAEALRRMREK